MTLGDRVKAQRRKLGLTQDELAATSGVSQTQISEMENNKTQGLATTVMALADALGVTMDWLVGGEERLAAAAAPEGEEAPPFWAEFLAKYEFVNELSAAELRGVRGFKGRTHRVTSYYDYVALAEWYRNHRVLEDFERIRAEEETE